MATGVLITAFEPFGKRTVNNSLVVGRAMERLASRFPILDVELLELPTVYDRAAESAILHIAGRARPPDIVLSLGEGGEGVRLETAAHNLDGGPHPDNAGEVRVNEVIDPSAPPSIGLTLPVHAMIECVPMALAWQFLLSVSPGSYVCNNTAFRLAVALQRPVQFGFVHVPIADSPNPPGARQLAGILMRMLAAVVAHNAELPTCSWLPHPVNGVRYPANVTEAEQLLAVCESGELERYRPFAYALVQRWRAAEAPAARRASR